MNSALQKIRTFLKYLILSSYYKRRRISVYPYPEKEYRQIVYTPARVNKDFPAVVWLYWEGAMVPYIVQKCVNRIKMLNPSFQVFFLTPETLANYLPDFKVDAENIPLANKTDLIRLELLYKYGGIWMDATIILNENLDWAEAIMAEKKYDCLAFWRENSTNNPKYPVVESWFLCSPPKNPFIKAWLEELKPLGEIGAKKYFEQIRKKSNYKDILQNIDRPEYLLVYLAQQVVMQRDNDFNLCLQSAEKTAFYYQEQLDWNTLKLESLFLFNESSDVLPSMIKLVNGNIIHFDYLLANGFVNTNSIFAKL